MGVDEPIVQAERAVPDLGDTHLDPDVVTLTHGRPEFRLGMDDRQADPGVDQVLERKTGRRHQGLVGVMGMPEEMPEEEHPRRIRVVEPNLEGVLEGPISHLLTPVRLD